MTIFFSFSDAFGFSNAAYVDNERLEMCSQNKKPLNSRSSLLLNTFDDVYSNVFSISFFLSYRSLLVTKFYVFFSFSVPSICSIKTRLLYSVRSLDLECYLNKEFDPSMFSFVIMCFIKRHSTLPSV